ncbi:hypothetical protein Aab01nite_30250 [Paractinoplanes abujensis]|uniref:Uncharacterized protein n=1 Tax=Paractinoplanes abujensis TaxID=882441 RepID=A0A7W7G701_9ACTN|nr:hypothetical protein [Actinoplanes abujensis]MBB4698079.1 hypothetical protein [Actinoplanes abujensis]GID19435.1 hypothetical protein Aab01nite_30250 [Actinoplanes abujensis]
MRIDTRAWWIAGLWALPTVFCVVSAFRFREFAGCGVLLALGLGLTTWVTAGRALTLRSLVGWAAAGGWTPIDPGEREWPWSDLHLKGSSRVRFAFTGTVDGLPITFGQVQWKGGAFGNATLNPDGRGLFVVVRLPLQEPPMAVRLPYVFVGDSPRLERPLLRQSFLSGEIPPFTVREHELFTVEPRDSWPDAAAAEQVVRRALLIVELLDVGPDAPW